MPAYLSIRRSTERGEKIDGKSPTNKRRNAVQLFAPLCRYHHLPSTYQHTHMTTWQDRRKLNFCDYIRKFVKSSSPGTKDFTLSSKLLVSQLVSASAFASFLLFASFIREVKNTSWAGWTDGWWRNSLQRFQLGQCSNDNSTLSVRFQSVHHKKSIG